MRGRAERGDVAIYRGKRASVVQWKLELIKLTRCASSNMLLVSFLQQSVYTTNWELKTHL